MSKEFSSVLFQKDENSGNGSNKIEASVFDKIEAIEEVILGNKERSEEEKEEYYQLLRELFRDKGAVEYADCSPKLREMARQGNIIVRRELPENIEKLLETKKLEIAFSDEQNTYPNSAVLESDLAGLRVAYAGGRGVVGKGSAAFVVGFNPTKETRVDDIPKNKFAHFEGHDRAITKITEGTVHLENVKFILLRLPKSFFPENHLTESESEKEIHHIQRMFIFENKKGLI